MGVCKEAGSGTGASNSNIDSINVNGATMVQDVICICSVIATHAGEESRVGAAEMLHETTLPQGAPGPSTRARTCSS